ncbi:MAG: thiamine pyrophosphate-dependent enzyme, partial [Planctomycetota bacterium]
MGPQVHPDIAGNLDLIDEQYARWLADPETVDPEWRSFLDGFALGAAQQDSCSGSEVQRVALGAAAMVAAFRARGHTCATIDPLAEAIDLGPLLPERFGLEAADLERPCPPCGLQFDPAPATIGALGAALRQVWCATIGAEIDTLDDPQRRVFLERELAGPSRPDPTAAPDPAVLAALARAERFETFIGTRLFGRTRFSLQGLESLVPGLERLAATAAAHGASRIELGMAHRGRLNVLAHLLAIPYERLIDTLRRVRDPEHPDPAGDVPYHREAEATRTFAGRTLTLRVSANPSHLETVGPVLLGRARATQSRGPGTAGVVPVVLHGDAAIAGQGIVLEAAQLGGLAGYGVGGCIHIVLDNGIGFTTAGPEGRSSRYCTAVAGLIGAPVLHVNAEDVDAVIFCCELALRYRQRFAADIFIDLVGYRRYGHNEGDDPRYTQPLVQRRIATRPTVVEAYAARFPDGEQRRRTLDQAVLAELHAAWDATPANPQAVTAAPPAKRAQAPACTTGQLNAWCATLTAIPDGFHAHPGVERLCHRRREAWKHGEALDWPWAETLAFASLLAEGLDVRLSGEDSRRGTFSQRHTEWIDQRSGASHWPLRQLAAEHARLEVVNSPLP